MLTLLLLAERTKPPNPRSGATRFTAKLERLWAPTTPAVASDRSLPEFGKPQRGVAEIVSGVEVGGLHDLLRDIRHGAAGTLNLRGVGNISDCLEVAAIEQHRVLQADFHTELVGIVQPHFADKHLNHHHRRMFVELADDAFELLVIRRRGRHDKAVACRFGDDDHLAVLQLRERADQTPGEVCSTSRLRASQSCSANATSCENEFFSR